MKINTNEATAQTHSRNYLVPQCPSALVTFPKTAFTLAETLITLAIIGVVAAMTIPSLVQKYQERVTVTKLKKVHSVLNNALRLSVAKHGEINNWGLGLAGNIDVTDEDTTQEEIDTSRKNTIYLKRKIVENLKVVNSCENYDTCCGHEQTRYTLDGQVFDRWCAGTFLADGSIIRGVTLLSVDCSSKRGDDKLLQNICGQIFVDVNGLKSPNTVGKDIFMFYYSKDGSVIPIGTKNETFAPFGQDCNRNTGDHILNGYGCTAWVIQNENMDYLHCDDLSWDGKHKCSDKD